jgi:hypothetical protein
MTTRARLERDAHAMLDHEALAYTNGGDARKLLALVEACAKWESALTPDGSVMIGEPELRAALRAVMREGV